MRAMSLAADEGEGEQMELRTLQEQLVLTQTLVINLSQQLNELKDQVRSSATSAKRAIAKSLFLLIRR
jgi:inositol 1,4,5-triphosphate receptor type 1